MKAIRLALLASFFTASGVFSQRPSDPGKSGLPGDNLNLASVMDIFRQSATLEEFEKNINTEDKRVNNLDLNNDGQTDYIRVLNYREGEVHTIILRTDLNRNDQQDLAVIYVKKENGNVKIQMVGDEALYGKNYIIEPTSEQARAGTPNPGYSGDANTVIVNNTTTNNYYNNNNYDYYPPAPATWPIVVYIYQPYYNPWISPWYWGYYPVWWRPWRPWFWDDYYYWWYVRHRWNGWWYFRPSVCYFNPYFGFYYKNKQTSNTVAANINAGKYDVSYQNPKPNPNVMAKPNPGTRPVNAGNEQVKPGEGKPPRTEGPVTTEPSRVRPAGQENQPSKPQNQPGRKPNYQPAKPATQPNRNLNYQPSKPANQPSRPSYQPSRPSSQPARPSGGGSRPSGGGQSKPGGR